MTTSRRSSSLGERSSQNRTAPMRKPPTQLTNSVPSGKPAQRAFSQRPARQRSERADDGARRRRPRCRARARSALVRRVAGPVGGALPAAMPQRASAASSATRASTQRAPAGAGFLLPERRLRLQVVHQELAGLERLAAVRRGDGDQHDLRRRRAARRRGGRRARRGSRSGASPRRSSPRSRASVMPG